jgi:predicted amidophosphoribosyltransferase
MTVRGARMPQTSDYPFTFLTPIECPHCGGNAPLMRRCPDPANPEREIRTFECSDCLQQTSLLEEARIVAGR